MHNLNILIPVFNTKDQLNNTLLSLKNQDSRDFSVYIHDNASTDGSSELISDFLKRADFEISYLRHSENIGGANNFLSLINLINDEYFVFLDSEDVISSSYVSSIQNCINELSPEVIIPNFYEWGINGQKRPILGPCEIASIPKNLRLASIAAMCNTSGLGYFFYGVYQGHKYTSLFKKILKLASIAPSPNLCEDIAFSYTIASIANEIVTVPSCDLLHYSKCIVDDNRLLLNKTGFKDILANSPPEIYLEALDIISKLSLIENRKLITLRDIITSKANLKNFQLILASTSD